MDAVAGQRRSSLIRGCRRKSTLYFLPPVAGNWASDALQLTLFAIICGPALTFMAVANLFIYFNLRYEYSPWLDGYKGQVGTFDPTQAKPIIVSGSGTVPDLTAQPAARNRANVPAHWNSRSSG